MVFLHSSLIVNISISCCETDRNVFSSPFFPIASIFGPKETILRGLGNQSVKVSIRRPAVYRNGFLVGYSDGWRVIFCMFRRKADCFQDKVSYKIIYRIIWFIK